MKTNRFEYISNLRIASNEDPLRVLCSACLTGVTCGYDGTANGEYPSVLKLLKYKTVKLIRFCPEEFAFGSPREMCDIHGGTGIDVLEGRAKVLTESGKDWSREMIIAAEKMLEIALEEKVELAVMMDISAACGSSVIYEGNRFSENKIYQIGAGVASALLMQNNIPVISQRDFASLEILYSKIDLKHEINSEAIDHQQTDWYLSYFGKNS
jgi:uncharacterized protein YbbK (DUF523 family)